MSEVDVGTHVQLACAAAALVFSVVGLVRDRRERRRVNALFEANATKYGRQRDGADRL